MHDEAQENSGRVGVSGGALDKRLRVAELLCEAAEVEHNLTCQYLFAAFSLKREPAESVTWPQLERIRSWQTSLLHVARQEMEHLGLVCNVLTALGESPYLARPGFPIQARHYPIHINSRLRRFDREALVDFIRFERPKRLLAGPERALFERVVPRPADRRHSGTIGHLYDEIAALLHDLADTNPYIGPQGAQLEAGQGMHGLDVPGAANYDVRLFPVIDAGSARAAITQIVTEGEGGPHPGSDQRNHFTTFCDMLLDLDALTSADAHFEPARPVAPPAQRPPSDACTAAVLDLFDLAYQTLMLMLLRYFAHRDESPAELTALGNLAFFPMMTAVIRPLGEIITSLPLAADSPRTAGPRFAFGRPVALLPHRRSARRVICTHLDLLAANAMECAQTRDLGPHQARIVLIAENLGRMACDFAAATEGLR